MRKALLVVVLAVLVSAMPDARRNSYAGEESVLAGIKERGVLRVGVFGVDTPPFYFVDKALDGMNGNDVDLAKAMAAHLGVGVEFKRFGPPFDKLLESVAQDEADIIVSSTSINPQREATYDTIIYDYTYFSFLIDLPGLEKTLGREVIEPSELNSPDVKILVQANTPFEGILKRAYPDAVQVPIHSNNNVGVMVEAMERGDAHVAFDRDLVFLIYERTNPESARRYLLHQLPDITGAVGLVLKKGSDLTPVIREFIEQRDEVQELSEIIGKYMKF